LKPEPRRRAAGTDLGSRRVPLRAHRSHHIAEVADHFLAWSPDAAPFVFLAGPAAGRGLVLELAAAWVHATGSEVSFVDGASSAAVAADAGVPGVRCHRPGVVPAREDGIVFWRWGPLGSRQLDDLDAVGRVPGGRLPGADRRRRLVWCPAADATARWRSLAVLGRLAGALQPGSVVLLVAPDGKPPVDLDTYRDRAGIAAGCDVALMVLPAAARPGARAAVLAGLPELLFPSSS